MVQSKLSRRVTAAGLLGILVIAATAYSQQIWVGGGWFSRTRPTFATAADFDGSFVYDVKAVPQVSNIAFWRSTGGETSEFGADTIHVHFRGIQDSHGRLMVVMSHNTDIADTWEREGAYPHEFFGTFSPRGYAVGVNVVLYPMTH